MNARKIYVSSILATLLLAGCDNLETTPEDIDIDRRVALQVTGGIHTRAVENRWEANDTIGIFMLNPDAGMDYPNVPYTIATDGESGIFSPVADGTTIYLPEDGTDRNFLAYYPYTDTKNLMDYIYSIDVSDQTDQSAIDFMMADMVTDKNVNDAKVTFYFRHKLAKVILHIKTGKGFSGNHHELAELATVTLTNQQTEGRYYIPNGGDVLIEPGEGIISLKINKEDPQNCTVEGIVFPSNNYDDMAFVFDMGVTYGRYKWQLSESKKSIKFEAGKKYEYNITLHTNNAVPGVRSSIKPWDDDK